MTPLGRKLRALTPQYVSVVPLRRFAALLTAIFTLHLSLLSADVACATHGANATLASAMHHDGMTSSAVSQAHGDAQVSAPCETPTQSHCCDALASCSVAVLGASSPAPRWFVEAASRVVAPHRSLSSLTLAPEPPPPKA